jgi:hypothetical protein
MRAMIAVYASEHTYSSTNQSVFSAKEVSNTKISKLYLDTIPGLLYAQE